MVHLCKQNKTTMGILVDKHFMGKVEADRINNLDLRSDLENNNIYACILKPQGYVGNRPDNYEGDFHEDDTWAIDCCTEDDVEVTSYLYTSESEYNEDLVTLTKSPTKYDFELVCTGQHKQDHMNSLIMEYASDLAEKLALKDWGDTRAGFYKEVEGGQTLSEEAQGIFNEYYDELTDEFYKFANSVVEIDRKEEEVEHIS